MRAFLTVEKQRGPKKYLCRSHNIIPTTAQQLDEIVTCGATSTSFSLSRPFSGRHLTKKNAVLGD